MSNNVDYLDLVNKQNPDRLEATAGNLLPVIIKALQDLSQKNKLLSEKNDQFINEISNLEK